MELYYVRLKLSQCFFHHRKISQRQRLPRNVKPIAYTIDSNAIHFVNNVLFTIVETQYSNFVILSVVGDVFADVFHPADIGEVVFGDMEDAHWKATIGFISILLNLLGLILWLVSQFSCILHVLLMVAKYVKCVSEVRCVNHAFKTAFHFLSSLLFLSLQRLCYRRPFGNDKFHFVHPPSSENGQSNSARDVVILGAM